MSAQVFAWTDADVTCLRELWGQGCTSTFIAKQLGVSRSTIMGKVRRLTLKQGPKLKPLSKAGRAAVLKPRPPKAERKGPAKRATVYANGSPPCLPQPAPRGEGVRIWELEPYHCKFIAGEATAEALYCGARCEPSLSYCPSHCAIVFRDPKEAKRMAARKWS